MKWINLSLLLFLPLCFQAQTSSNLLRMQPDSAFENILIRKIATDTTSTSFVIWVKENVSLHYHAFHTESLLVLEGAGTMIVGDETVFVSPGDFLSIPPNTFHDLNVTSEEPLKALSIQAPEFLGKDRIYAGQLRYPDSRK